jgi:hypothetical protein
VLGLRFAHSFGLLHDSLTTGIVFDSDHCIQIVDFDRKRLKISENKSEEGPELGGFSEQRWTPEIDVHGFASILFEIVFGCPRKNEAFIPKGAPSFVRQIIKSGLYLTSEPKYSLEDILGILKNEKFQIEDGVHSTEVSAFVSWVESAEYSEK